MANNSLVVASHTYLAPQDVLLMFNEVPAEAMVLENDVRTSFCVGQVIGAFSPEITFFSERNALPDVPTSYRDCLQKVEIFRMSNNELRQLE